MKDLHQRIVIIGAGPAGLTAAETLREKGYKNITILEKSNRAGGKCFSFEHEQRFFELGAGIIASNNKIIFHLAEKFGVKIVPVKFDTAMLFVGQEKPTLKKIVSLVHEIFFTYRKLAKRYRKIVELGFKNLDPSVCVPFSVWAARHNLLHLSEQFAYLFTGWGYGYFDEIPAAYILKYYSWELLQVFLKKQIFRFPGGIQHLWITVAAAHKVLYNVSIQKIERREGVAITTATEKLQFDVMIITSPLDEALQYLDAGVEETSLFTQIIYCDYRTYACFVKNFPRQDGYLSQNYNSSRAGHPVFWHLRHHDMNLYTFYVLGDWKISDQEVLENIHTMIRDHGGTLEKTHKVVHWKYFPHVNSENMKNGYFDILENLQGERHTYYAGELLNFSTVGMSSAYAQQLVERNF